MPLCVVFCVCNKVSQRGNVKTFPTEYVHGVLYNVANGETPQSARLMH